MQLTVDFLALSDYGLYDKPLARALGLLNSCLLCLLVEKRKYVKIMTKGKLISHSRHGDGWFYCTLENIEHQCGVKPEQQTAILNKLRKFGLIEQVTIGQPGKRHFRINDKKILELRENSEKEHYKKIYNSYNPETTVTDTEDHVSHAVENGIYEPETTESPSLYTILETDTRDKNLHIALPCDKTDQAKTREKEAADAACVCDPSLSKYQKWKEERPPKQKKVEVKPLELAIKVKVEDKVAYGEEQIVMMTPTQYEKLLKLMPPQEVEHWITKLQNWMLQIGEPNSKKYKDHYRTILNWRERDLDKYKDSQGRDMSKIAPHRRGFKSLTPGDFDVDIFQRPKI